MSAVRSDDVADALRRLVFAARSGGLTHLVGALRSALGAEVGLFDLGGSMIATAPARAIWDAEAVRRAAGRTGEANGFLVHPVEYEGEPVALLAARVHDDRGRLLDAAADLIVLELARLRAAQQGRRELAASLIDDVLARRVDEVEAIGRLRAVGVDATVPHRVLLGSAEMPGSALQRLPWGGIYALMGNRPDPFLRIVRDDSVLMVVPDDPMVERIAQNLCGQLAEIGAHARVGVSRSHVGGAGLRAAYLEALSALRDGDVDGVRHPGRLDLSRLLVMTNTTVPLADVARDQLRPLIEHDAAHGSALVETLHVYLEADRDVAAATGRLFIHRNTLRYRLRQITEILGADIESSATIATLWLAYLALADEPGPMLASTTPSGATPSTGAAS
ncbi:PucR family transcriptional regulator [Agromyces bracchium]|uniref:PucR family transcriptional regulator n=1 Tax=Agromyces bracchium TaxID=88376 RepID=UPI0018AD077C|nr:helix-turn-helix domain-containing protein [Agromyces bracchium]